MTSRLLIHAGGSRLAAPRWPTLSGPLFPENCGLPAFQVLGRRTAFCGAPWTENTPSSRCAHSLGA